VFLNLLINAAQALPTETAQSNQIRVSLRAAGERRVVVEVGDIRRFDHPRQLMAFLGLVPSEYSSGPSVRRGGITKAGNPHARRLLAEAAWAYQGVPRIGRQMLYRQEALPKPICDIAWKAQLRLTSRFRKLVARGKAKPKVATAIARELTGFIWAIAREVPPPPA